MKIKLPRRNKDNSAFKGNRKEGIEWYPTGWTYSEKTGKWERPDFMDKTEKQERYKEYRKGKEPTFEEWKAARQKENDPPEK